MDYVKKILDLHESKNIADELDEQELLKIGQNVVDEYTLDKNSRADWEDIIAKSIDIAKQVVHQKTFPWSGAANVKFPLMSNAAIQFAARTYPELIQDGRVVEAYAAGQDPQGLRADRAKRISAFMSYQLLVESDEWERDTDKLLHMLPIVGTVFRKTYYDPITKHPCSELCNPDDIVIHNSAKSLESARRVSHRLFLYKNDIIERIRAGIFREVDLTLLLNDTPTDMNKNDPEDTDKSYEFIEQHRYLDLDKDGYKEPYIVTVHKSTNTVLKIISRWDVNGVKFSKDGKVLQIEPVQYFTDYHFIPSFDGSFYSLGFGTLLYALNESTNSVFNQLLDAGTLSNLQAGFLGSGLRLEGGRLNLAPGEWKKIPTMGSAIQDNVFPMPTREPSQTLFNMLQLLIQTGKDLSGVIDILPDDQQTQNVPATTIISLLDQRLKPLKSIFKRIYRSFKKEFEKLYRLNSLYLPDEQFYFTVLNDQQAIAKSDFIEPDYDVKPIADPSMSSESQRIMKLQMLAADLQTPLGQFLNAGEITARKVKELNMPNPQALLQPPPPPQPSPEQMKTQVDMANIQRQAQKDQQDYDVALKNFGLKTQELSNKKELDEAKIVNLHAKSMLDAAIAQRDHHARVADQYQNMLQMAIDKQHKETELDLQQQEIKNDQLQLAQGMGSSSGNNQA